MEYHLCYAYALGYYYGRVCGQNLNPYTEGTRAEVSYNEGFAQGMADYNKDMEYACLDPDE